VHVQLHIRVNYLTIIFPRQLEQATPLIWKNHSVTTPGIFLLYTKLHVPS